MLMIKAKPRMHLGGIWSRISSAAIGTQHGEIWVLSGNTPVLFLANESGMGIT